MEWLPRYCLAETKICRFKRIGERIMSRDFNRQVAELHGRTTCLTGTHDLAFRSRWQR